MTGVVVDASVAVKWLVDEEFSSSAARLLDADFTLVAPELLFAEVSNALWAMRRRGDITPDDLAEAVDVLKSAPVAVPASMRQLAAAAVKNHMVAVFHHDKVLITGAAVLKNPEPVCIILAAHG